MDFRCLVMRRDNCTNTGMRQRRAQEIQRSFAFFALNGEDVSHQSSYGSFGEDRGFDGSFVKDQRRSMPPVRQPHGPDPQRLPSRSMMKLIHEAHSKVKAVRVVVSACGGVSMRSRRGRSPVQHILAGRGAEGWIVGAAGCLWCRCLAATSLC